MTLKQHFITLFYYSFVGIIFKIMIVTYFYGHYLVYDYFLCFVLLTLTYEIEMFLFSHSEFGKLKWQNCRQSKFNGPQFYSQLRLLPVKTMNFGYGELQLFWLFFPFGRMSRYASFFRSVWCSQPVSDFAGEKYCAKVLSSCE